MGKGPRGGGENQARAEGSINRAGVRFIILHRSYNPVATLLLLSHYVRNLASGKAPPRLVTRDAAPHSRGITKAKNTASQEDLPTTLPWNRISVEGILGISLGRKFRFEIGFGIRGKGHFWASGNRI